MTGSGSGRDEDGRGPRRKRRGHKKAAPDSTQPTQLPRRGKVDPRTYAQVMERIKAFVEARLVKLVTPVARGFFTGCSQDEIKREDLQSAFFLFFVLGYRDPNGVRVLDMYRGYGFKPSPVEARAVDALDATRLRLVEVVEKVEANRQLQVVDKLNGDELRVTDQEAYKSLSPGDGMMAWFMPSSEVHRPLEVATHVKADLLGPMVQGLETLANENDLELSDLPHRRPAQMFWAIYRSAQRFQS